MKQFTRPLALLLSILMLVSVLAGCGSSSTTADASSAQTDTEIGSVEAAAEDEASVAEETATEEEAENPEETAEEVATIAYPIDGNVTISVWRAFESMMWDGLMEGYSDMPLLETIMTSSGVEIEFVSVNDASSTESFNLMIAGGDWADLVGLDSYTGGLSKAYEDGLCYDLTDYLEEYMPDYANTLNWLEENYPNAYKATVTNDGNILSVYSIYSYYAQEQGLVYRGDWADECGLDEITTLDDLSIYLDYVVATYSPKYAMTPSTGGLIDGITTAFGIVGFDASGESVDLGLYLEDGQVVSSMTSEKFRTYIEWFADCYASGAVYADFYSETYGPDWINSYFADDDVAISFLRSDNRSTFE